MDKLENKKKLEDWVFLEKLTLSTHYFAFPKKEDDPKIQRIDEKLGSYHEKYGEPFNLKNKPF